MNKKWKLISYVLAGALLFGVSGTTLTGCKDYDDDINHLQEQVDANKKSIDDILAKIKAGQYIQNVEKTANGIKVTLGDGSTAEIVNGKDGLKGETGAPGKTTLIEISDDGYWVIDGTKTTNKAVGEKGEAGVPGKSAYDLAKENGFTGTVEEWLTSLQGENGVGLNGKSAYEIYVETVKEGEPLSPEAWLASLKGVKGEDGKSAYDIYKTTVAEGTSALTEEEWLLSLAGVSPKIDEQTGNWLVYDVKTKTWVDTKVNAAGTDLYVVKAAEPIQGWTLYIKEQKEDGTFSEDYVKIFMPGAATYVTSLVHLPNSISAKYGDVIFFPVIATDYEKINEETKKTYTYDVVKKEKYATLYKGWAEIEYAVNPNSVSAYKPLGFINRQAAVTRATDKTIRFESDPKAGNLAISAQGFQLVKNNKKYDDPEGDKADHPYVEEADMIAFQVQNTNEKQDIVTSDFAVAKRLVVGQRDINIEFIEKDGKYLNEGVVKPELHTFTLENLKKKDQYLSHLAVNLAVPFKTTKDNPLHLQPLLESCVDRIFTNIDDEENRGHITLAKLGFKDLTMKFTAVDYKNAEVDQTMDYLELDGDAISFNQKNTAAGYRQPVVKVSLLHAGELVTEKLLKIQVISTVQENLTENEQLGPWTLGCKEIAKSEINMDDYFNACGFNKDQFYEIYGTPAVTFTKNGEAYNGGDIMVDGTMSVNATNGKNYLKFRIGSTVEAGDYVAKIVYSANNTSAPYKTITINASFTVQYPKNGPLVVNENMWNGAKQMEISPADYSTGKAEYMGIIENGFNDFTKVLSQCPDAEATLHFALSDPKTQKVNEVLVSEVVTIEEKTIDGKKRHVIKLKNCDNGKKLVGEAVKLRAWVTFNNANANHAQYENVTIDLTGSHLFDVKFVKPITAEYVENDKLWLVDLQDDLSIALGSFLKIYNFQGDKNGMIWDNLKGWQGANDEYLLRGYNIDKVTYALAKGQDNYNTSCVELNKGTGIIQWKTKQQTPGEVFPDGKTQPINFVASIHHHWGVEEVTITVIVKDKTKDKPDSSNIKHLPNGTKWTK